jgi:uncharacterized protein (DUF1330 family)
VPAYIIARVKVTDADRYAAYRQASPGAIEAGGGRFLVRGGESITLEGPDEARRLVILEFPSLEQARAFYESDVYVEARALREGAAEMEMVAVEGVA